MSEEIAVIERQSLAVAPERPVHRTRAAICAIVGIQDNPDKSLSVVIKEYLKSKGLKGKDLQAEYTRILREETAPLIAGKIDQAVRDGWLPEYRAYKLDKTGNEVKFAVIYSAPKKEKVTPLSVSQYEKLMASVGGKDTAQGKQMEEFITKQGMTPKAFKIRDVEATSSPVEGTQTEPETAPVTPSETK